MAADMYMFDRIPAGKPLVHGRDGMQTMKTTDRCCIYVADAMWAAEIYAEFVTRSGCLNALRRGNVPT